MARHARGEAAVSRPIKLSPSVYRAPVPAHGLPVPARIGGPQEALDHRSYAQVLIAAMWLLLGLTAAASANPIF
jgi:hypothetical protein